MIFTRWGNKIRVIGGDVSRGLVQIKFKDQTEQWVGIMDLKADGGIKEIVETITKGNKE